MDEQRLAVLRRNDLIRDSIIGIASLVIALICGAKAGQQQLLPNSIPWGNLMIAAICFSGVFLFSVWGQSSFYAGKWLARAYLEPLTKPQRIAMGIATGFIGFFAVTQIIRAISWYEGLISWPTVFWIGLIIFVISFGGGIVNIAIHPTKE